MPNELESRVAKIQGLRRKLDEAAFNIVKTDPWVPITLKGEQFKLEYSYFAVKTMYQEAGMKLTDNGFDMALLSDPELLAKALMYGLVTHHPAFDAEAVERHINMRHRVYYANCIRKAIEATQPDLSDLDAETPAQEDSTDPLAGTGISLASGPSAES